MSTMRVNTLVNQSGTDIALNANLIVTGDLTVIGDNFTATVTDLTVADQNITVNDGGNDATSEGAGLTVFRTGTFGSLIYADALASKWACGALGSESEIITSASVQTLTAAKTFSSLITANDGINVIGSNLAVGSTSPVSLIHVRGSGTSAGTASPGILFENFSSGTAGMYVTGTAGISSLNIGFANVPGTGFDTFSDALKLTIEGANAGRFEFGTSSFSGGHIVRGGLFLPSASATALNLDFYASESLNTTYTFNNGGPTTSSVAVHVSRIGNLVTVTQFAGADTPSSASGSDSASSNTALPVWARPFISNVPFNSTWVAAAGAIDPIAGGVAILTDGTILVRRRVDLSLAWGGSNNSSGNFSISYII